MPTSPRDTGLKSKWPGKLLDDGFIPVARRFLRNYWRLEPVLTESEVIFVINLVDYTWKDGKAFPSWQKLSFDLGIPVEVVLDTLNELSKKGYLEFVSIDEANDRGSAYRLSGLYRKLEELPPTASWSSVSGESADSPRKQAAPEGE